MRVLQIHRTDAPVGGGPIAMLRLQEGIRKAGVSSKILCLAPTRVDSVAIPSVRGETRLRSVTWRLGFNDLHVLGSFKIQNLAAYAEADLLHIHCLHGGFFNLLGLPTLTKTKPAIYTLHDMWPFTGHCVHSFDCDRWKRGCGACPYPKLPNEIQRDATWWEWKAKEWIYRRSDLTIVAASKWMEELARQSMLSHFPIRHIPHGVDTDIYKPSDPEMSRAVLGIPARKKVLLYMVRQMDPSTKDAWMKGADLLVRAVQELPPSLRRETVLLLVGEGSEALARELDMVAMPLGFINSDQLKVIVCSAADLLVHPSRGESFGLVLIESMACGTPVVAFNVGGIPDVVRPGLTGYLAEREDPKQLAAGIVQLLEDEPLHDLMKRRSREMAVNEFNLDLHIKRHIELYRQTLDSVAV